MPAVETSIVQDEATLTLAMLDQQFQYLLGQEKERRLLLLPRLLSFLSGEPRVAAIVRDLREEAAETLAQLGREDGEVRRKLADLWATHEADVRRLLSGIQEEALNAYGTMDAYAAALQSASMPALEDDGEWPPTNPVSALRHWILSAQHHAQQAGSEVPQGFNEALAELGRLAHVQQHQARRMKLSREGLAWHQCRPPGRETLALA
jgi:hypothetical protein